MEIGNVVLMSTVVCSPQLSDKDADDGLLGVMKIPNLLGILIACNLEMVLLTKFLWDDTMNMLTR